MNEHARLGWISQTIGHDGLQEPWIKPKNLLDMGLFGRGQGDGACL